MYKAIYRLSILVVVAVLVDSSNWDVFNCDHKIEVVLLQDLSLSSINYIDDLVRTMREFATDIQSNHINTKFGYATFTDKPIYGFGNSIDWCYKVEKSLKENSETGFYANLGMMELGHGRDWQENQLGAIYELAGDTTGEIQWTDGNFDSDGTPVIKILIIVTNSAYHVAGDGIDEGLVPNDNTGVTRCQIEDYPKIEKVAAALRKAAIYPIFLTAKSSVTADLYAVYNELLDTMGMPGAVYDLGNNYHDNLLTTIDAAVMSAVMNFCQKRVVDVMVVMDLSHSYGDDIDEFRRRLRNALDMTEHDDYSFDVKVGLATFIDKPVLNFGDRLSGDYCYKLEGSLTRDFDYILTIASQLVNRSGLDWKESQLDAMLSVAVDANVGWRLEEMMYGHVVERFIIVATDSGFHLSPDYANSLAEHGGSTFVDRLAEQLHQNVFPVELNPVPATEKVVDCIREEYTTIQLLSKVLKEKRIRPIFLTTHGLIAVYEGLLQSLNVEGSVDLMLKFSSSVSLIPPRRMH